MCFYSNLSPKIVVGHRYKGVLRFTGAQPFPIKARLTFIMRTKSGFIYPHTRTYVRLLGPCFKTGRLEPFRLASSDLSARKYSPDPLGMSLFLVELRSHVEKSL